MDLAASIDTIMQEHLEHTTVFKGTSKTIQNKLLNCMLEVMQGHIIFFFGFKTIDGQTNANSISKVLLEQLRVV